MEVFVLIAAVVIAATVAGIWYEKSREKKREKKLAIWARSGGWGWSPERRDDPGLSFSIFDDGHTRYSHYHARRRSENSIPGLGPTEVELFEYHYAVTTSTGKGTITAHYHFVCALVESGLELGSVLIRPEGWGDKLVQALGFDDIDFEDVEFSKRFVVKASDRKQAYDLIDGPLMNYLVEHQSWHVETRGGLLFAHASARASPERYEALSCFALGLLEQLPRPLINAERARRGLPPELDAGNASHRSRERHSG